MFKDLSPEEKLLRLIKGKPKSPFGPEEMVRPETEGIKPGAEEKEIPKKDEKITPAEVEKETEKEKRPSYQERPPQQIKARLPEKLKVAFDIRYLYIISGVVLSALIVVFIYNILSGREKQELEGLERMIAAISEQARVESSKAEEAKTPPEEKLPPENTKPEPQTSFKEYQKLLTEKSIFASPVKDRKESPIPGGPTLRELVKDLRLVGVIPGDEPQAIIEDKKSGQTLFLKKGEQIEDMEIRQIESGRVVLGYEEETVTLSL